MTPLLVWPTALRDFAYTNLLNLGADYCMVLICLRRVGVVGGETDEKKGEFTALT